MVIYVLGIAQIYNESVTLKLKALVDKEALLCWM